MAKFGPQGHDYRIYKGKYKPLQYTKYKTSGLCGFSEEDFFLCFFFNVSLGGANDPWG